LLKKQVVKPVPLNRENWAKANKGENDMLWTILVVLLILWLLGFGFGVGGSLIHIILVVALVVLVINLLQGRRTI